MVQITWLGHAAFAISDGNFCVLVDPWLENPKGNKESKQWGDKADVILLTHGHSDHVGQTLEIAQKTGAKVYAIYELALSLKEMAPKGFNSDQIIGCNKGGWVSISPESTSTSTESSSSKQWKILMTMASHSSGCCSPDGKRYDGGECAGWIIQCSDGNKVYHCGDTGLFGDMKTIISDIYQPNIALLCIGGHFTMGPEYAGVAIDKFLPSVKTVVPMHYGTFPLLAGTPEKLESFVKRTDVIISTHAVGKPVEYSL